MNIKLIELIKDNKVYFDSYRQGFFYYNINKVTGWETDIYQFPVPLDDIGNATLLKEDKAITFMRWLRKSIEDGTFIKMDEVKIKA